jgi:gamma-glutamyltranspeptidase/glutathione hydrolase
MDDWTYHVGHAQGIVFNQETGVIMGGADPRGDGIALAW